MPALLVPCPESNKMKQQKRKKQHPIRLLKRCSSKIRQKGKSHDAILTEAGGH
jgi:hypothetical protein